MVEKSGLKDFSGGSARHVEIERVLLERFAFARGEIDLARQQARPGGAGG